MPFEQIKSSLPEGSYLMQGDAACAEGAIAAGCRFYAGYPITPASEVMERIVERFPEVDGVFTQMEDEIASICSVAGAAFAGAKAMTATSGPGMSLMMEGISYAVITECPCVIVDVQRAGPSTGQATRPGSADLMQAKWGPHSDNEMIALSPWSVQEMYDMTIRCFNLAERFRVPTILLADETVGHLREKFQVPGHLTVFNRDRTKGLPPFDTAAINGVPPLPAYGEGAHLLVTGSTHDGWGFRKTTDSKVQEKLTNRLQRKIRDFAEQEIIEVEEYGLTPLCEGVIIANGFTARAALRVVNELQAQGKNIGLLRLKTIWPFAEQAIARLDLMPNLKWIVVPEMNRGQIVGEVMKYTNKEIIPFNKTNGEVIYPEEIRQVIRKLL